jgi:hypothetical protein
MSDTEIAKSQLRDHLRSLLIPYISQGFWSIYDSSKELCQRNQQLDQILRTFQNMLTKIPDWSESTLTTEVERIQKATKCNYFEDLLMGVFISYMKSFASLHYNEGTELKIDFEPPPVSKFIHELYNHSARKLWQTAYLFKTTGSSEEQARNRQEILSIISGCLEQVITNFLPWESITKKYFKTQPHIEEQSKEEEREDKKSVTFEEDSDEETEEEDSDEEIPKLLLSDEPAILNIEELPKEESPPEVPKEEEDIMKSLETQVSESLVLNL